MRIAFLGSRGIPRCYSGFETFVEEVSVRLVARGHEVVVYNRVPFNTWSSNDFKGVRIVRMPTVQGKGSDTLVHSALCTLHSLGSKHDIAYYCGVGSSIFSLPGKLRGAKSLVNVDGADWERAKWGTLGKTWLRWSERLAARLADCVIADHPIIASRYKRQFGIDCATITYGADVVREDPGKRALDELGLVSGGYLLYVSRLTPENRADLVMQSHLESNASLPLVVVGDAPYVNDFVANLRRLAEGAQGRIMMTGYRFGEDYRQLSYHARAFVFPTTIEATRPVLLEQMGMGGCVVARDTEANRFLLGDAAVWFGGEGEEEGPSLVAALNRVAAPDFDKSEFAERARERIRRNHDWDVITTQYERLFEQLLGKGRLTTNVGGS